MMLSRRGRFLSQIFQRLTIFGFVLGFALESSNTHAQECQNDLQLRQTETTPPVQASTPFQVYTVSSSNFLEAQDNCLLDISQKYLALNQLEDASVDLHRLESVNELRNFEIFGNRRTALGGNLDPRVANFHIESVVALAETLQAQGHNFQLFLSEWTHRDWSARAIGQSFFLLDTDTQHLWVLHIPLYLE